MNLSMKEKQTHRKGTLRPEAKVAKGYFALSDEVFDGLVEEMKARSKKQGGASHA